jgi:hypothetical protein
LTPVLAFALYEQTLETYGYLPNVGRVDLSLERLP